ncbi:KDM5A [Bugula neritina]|uniref:KDM5A n=1 Tax=Bugula neritina TaxID=10212 RepID=A0A7J7K006_BUGNE|nr:KDM5A [Bugula neritina]
MGSIPRYIISSIEVIINEAKDIPARLPNVLALKEALIQAKQWNSDVDTLNAADHYPYLDALEELVNKGRPIPVRLEFLSQLESQVTAAKSWRERTARTFLKKNSTYSLIEVLSPRIDVGIYPVTKKRKKKENELLPATMDKNEKQFSNPAHMWSRLRSGSCLSLNQCIR